MTTTRLLRLAAALTAAAGTLAACSSSASPSGTVAATAPASRAIATTSPPVDPAPPSTRSQAPDGVYRTSLTKDEVFAAGGDDPSSAGTWTLTLNNGTYQLHCEWVDNDGDDCGHSGEKKATVEAGTTAGNATYLWLEYSKAATVKITGRPEGAPDDYNYRLTWKLQGQDLVLTALWSGDRGWQPGDVNGYTIKPWKRIS